MKRVLLTTILSLTSFNLFSQEMNCDSENELTRTAKSLSIPNCVTQEKIDGFRNKLNTSFCNDCKSQFEKFEKIAPIKKNVQEDFFQASLDEYNT